MAAKSSTDGILARLVAGTDTKREEAPVVDPPPPPPLTDEFKAMINRVRLADHVAALYQTDPVAWISNMDVFDARSQLVQIASESAYALREMIVKATPPPPPVPPSPVIIEEKEEIPSSTSPKGEEKDEQREESGRGEDHDVSGKFGVAVVTTRITTVTPIPLCDIHNKPAMIRCNLCHQLVYHSEACMSKTKAAHEGSQYCKPS